MTKFLGSGSRFLDFLRVSLKVLNHLKTLTEMVLFKLEFWLIFVFFFFGGFLSLWTKFSRSCWISSETDLTLNTVIDCDYWEKLSFYYHWFYMDIWNITYILIFFGIFYVFEDDNLTIFVFLSFLINFREHFNTRQNLTLRTTVLKTNF